jgi:hypothetical protein
VNGATSVQRRRGHQVAGDIDAQIYARDFKLIDQSDMIVSYVPELPDGIPGLSSGVERELQHAFEGTKEVYVVWKPKWSRRPSSPKPPRGLPRRRGAVEHFHGKPRERGRFG